MEGLLRLATKEDYEAVCLLFAQTDSLHADALPQIFRPGEGPARSRKFFEKFLDNENAAIFVVEQHGELIGLILCDVQTVRDLPFLVPRHFVSIWDLIVSERFRHQGIGIALLERVHQWTREKGLTEVELGVWEFNTPARTLYEKLGYKTTRRTMSKRL